MEPPKNASWRAMFDDRRPNRPPGQNSSDVTPSASAAPVQPTYDDGHVSPPQTAPLSSEVATGEALASLAADPNEYRPWVLQRGRSRPVMMLHLRRFDRQAGFWKGWAVSYPYLNAVDYVGDQLISLDFGTRHFMLEGRRLGELVDHLQNGVVLCIQEYAPSVWTAAPNGPVVTAIRQLKQGG